MIARLLTADEEITLCARAQSGDAEATRLLVEHNQRLVLRLSGSMAAKSPQLKDDLISEGNIGLLKAIAKFKPRHNTRFSTYAVPWIQQGMLRLIHASDLMRLPDHRATDLRRYRVALSEAQQRFINPTREQVAEIMGTSVIFLEKVEALHYRSFVSIDAPIYEGASYELSEMIAAPLEAPITMREAILTSTIEYAGVDGKGRENRKVRTMIERYYGLDGGGVVMEEIGRDYQITRERVRQLIEQGLINMRRAFLHIELTGYYACPLSGCDVCEVVGVVSVDEAPKGENHGKVPAHSR